MAIDPPAGDEGITDKAPAPKRPARFSDSDSDSAIGRPSSSSSGWTIAIVAGLAAIGLCLCVPAVFLGGFVSLFAVREQRNVAVVQQAEAVAMDQDMKVLVDGAKVNLTGFANGADDAKEAVAKDQLLLKEYPPLPAPGWHGDYIKLLKEKCKCDYQVIVAPNLTKDQQDEIKGWNETIQTELRRRHGATIIEDLHKESEARWRDRIKPKEKK